MTNDFEVIGDKNNPYHLSVGCVVIDNSTVGLIQKRNDIITLPRETIKMGGSLINEVKRGAREELGIEVEVLRFLGALGISFSRVDGTLIDKTTLYFLCEKTGDSIKIPEDDEIHDVVLWLEIDEAIATLKTQDNEEYKIVKRAKI